jgi:hypothetical protein
VAPRIDRPSRVVVVGSINEDLSVLVDRITNPGETSPTPGLCPGRSVTDSVMTARRRGRSSRLTLSAAISPEPDTGVGEEQHDDSVHLVGTSVEIAVLFGAMGWQVAFARSSAWPCVRYRFSCLTGRASRCPCFAADLDVTTITAAMRRVGNIY